MAKHVITAPIPALVSSSGRAEVWGVPAASDNIVWILLCVETNAAAIIDGPSADEALALLEERGATLRAIFNTHTHGDHIGVNRALQRRGLLEGLEVAGASSHAAQIPGLTRGLDEGDALTLGRLELRVWKTEGHLDGHLSFLIDDLLFCGDTLFTGGCGRIFEGPARKMHQSLTRFASLDPQTRICCAHEYTQDNLRFAWSVEADNAALKERIGDTWRRRARGETLVPSTLGLELATNPFLRTDQPTIRAQVRAQLNARLGEQLATQVAEWGPDLAYFAATRKLKDTGDYRAIRDEEFLAP